MKALGPRLAQIVALSLCGPAAHAIILYSTGDPTANTTAPTGALANSGWQYENSFLSFNGYPIAPDSFVVSKHILGALQTPGNPSVNFTYLGQTYTTVARFDAPNGGDLTVLKIDPAINGPFPSFVPLYRKTDELGKNFVVFGRGSERGPEVNIPPTAITTASPNGTFRGWEWGGNTGTQRWGENTVSQILTDSGPGGVQQFLYSNFTPPTAGGLANEAALSVGDSSGGVFILDIDDNTWKLAGLNSGVDATFIVPPGITPINMALIDAGGLYDGTNQLQDTTNLDLAFGPDYQVYSGSGPFSHLVGNYHTRISTLTPWLDSIAFVPEAPPSAGLLAGAVFVGGWWISRRNRMESATASSENPKLRWTSGRPAHP